MTKKRQNLKVSIVLITQELATKWLEEKNTKNRYLSPKRVSNLTLAINAGDFVFNGDTIKFDFNGELMDGQHRLKAIVKADEKAVGKGIQIVIVEGLDPEARKYIDTNNKSRSLFDAIVMEGLTCTDTILTEDELKNMVDEKIKKAKRKTESFTENEKDIFYNDFIDEDAKKRQKVLSVMMPLINSWNSGGTISKNTTQQINLNTSINYLLKHGDQMLDTYFDMDGYKKISKAFGISIEHMAAMKVFINENKQEMRESVDNFFKDLIKGSGGNEAFPYMLREFLKPRAKNNPSSSVRNQMILKSIILHHEGKTIKDLGKNPKSITQKLLDVDSKIFSEFIKPETKAA